MADKKIEVWTTYICRNCDHKNYFHKIEECPNCDFKYDKECKHPEGYTRSNNQNENTTFWCRDCGLSILKKEVVSG